MPELRVNALSKAFGPSVLAANDLSFDVADREFVFLLGPSGAGKTTTLRMIAGLDAPDAGRIKLAGRDITPLAPRDRNVAMVYDKHSLYPHLSAFENMAYPLRVRRMPEAEIRKKVAEVAEILQIGRLLDRDPTRLSGGQQQRVAIGRMLVRSADLFLMDEPISHLDAKLRAHMRIEFKKLQKEFAATILYVSHDQLEAMTMGDRIVVLDHGTVQQIGTPRDVFDRPANLFVATFVGEPQMNCLPGQLECDGGDWRIVGEGFSIAPPREWVIRNELDKLGRRPLTVGIRPADVTVVEEGDVADRNLTDGRTYAVEVLGSEIIVDVEIGRAVVRAMARTAEVGSGRRIGDRVACHLESTRIHLFDAETGIALAHPAPLS